MSPGPHTPPPARVSVPAPASVAPDGAATQAHWEQVYTTKAANAVSWYQPEARTSLALIAARVGPDAAILDVGSGASTLVDGLLAWGARHLAVLDIAASALALARTRLGQQAERVQWWVGDVHSVALPAQGLDLWHDRAVFHFLTEPQDQARYARQLHAALRPGGHAIVATFALDGPVRCSGLPVARHSPESLATVLGPGLRLVQHLHEHHTTPGGARQAFVYACFVKDGPSPQA